MSGRTWRRLEALGLIDLGGSLSGEDLAELEEMGLRGESVGLSREELARLQNTEGAPALLLAAASGVLRGAISVAFDVRADELVGPLSLKMGGSARKLRVTDVREKPEFELRVLTPVGEERWATPDARALVTNLNDLYRTDVSVAKIAVLGEWNDALQLWCVPAEILPKLEREAFFEPQNRRELFGSNDDRRY